MTKKKKLSWIFCFLLLIYLIPMIGQVLVGSGDSSQENRKMNEKPVFKIQSYEEYPMAYDAYFNDHIPLRSRMIEAANAVSYFIFHISPDTRVIPGKEGWLFFSGTVTDYLGEPLLDENELKAIASRLEENQEYLAGKGIKLILFLGPNKNTIYGEYMPDAYVKAERSRCDQLVEYLRDNTDIQVVYPKEELLRAKEENPELELYHRTDTHWNHAGAYIGARTLAGELGVDLPELSQVLLTKIVAESGGDLTGMIGLKKYFKGEFDYQLSGFTENHILSQEGDFFDSWNYRTDAKDTRTVLINRDSFTEAMHPVLGAVFRETRMPNRSYYTKAELDEMDPDVFVLEIVERDIAKLRDIDVRKDGSGLEH